MQFLVFGLPLFSFAVASQECSRETSEDTSLLQKGIHTRTMPPSGGSLWWPPCKSCTETTTPPPPPSCPYDFTPPKCSHAGPQAPRNVSDPIKETRGRLIPKAVTLSFKEVEQLHLANIHFHRGAEHFTFQYGDDKQSKIYDKMDPSHRVGPRPGFMCASKHNKNALAPHKFKYCKNVTVGESYEVHWVYSSAKVTVSDGLGAAANGGGQLNPMIGVRAQVFRIVNGAAGIDGLQYGWQIDPKAVPGQVKYSGSTTGTKFNNHVCSPYTITWHVDRTCYDISPESFDHFCFKLHHVWGLEEDLSPHGSRQLVAPPYVVRHDYVTDLF